MAQLMVAAMRLCLTANKDELVAEDDPRAAFLYASVGDEIPQSAVEKFGLVDGKLPVVDADAAVAAAEAQRLADEAAAEAQRLADEAAAEAQRLADEAAAEAKRKADEEAAAAEAAAKKAAEDGGDKGDGDAKEDGEGATKEAKPGKTKG